MAVTQNTLIGRTKNSIGGVTFSTWKGLNVAKSKPISVANPNTPGQQVQRNRLSALVAIYRLISQIIQIGFRTLAINKSQYNAFVSENIIQAFTVNPDNSVTFVPSELVTGKGTIGSIPIVSLQGQNGSNSVIMEWNETLTPVGSNGSDIANLIVYNATQDNWGIGTGEPRDFQNASATMPTNVNSGDVLHGYLFFSSVVDSNVSDSSYLTSVTP